jgi:hypothetical protein
VSRRPERMGEWKLSIKPRAFPHGTRNQNDQQRCLNSLGLVRGLVLFCAVLSLSVLEGCLSRALTSLQILPAANSETVSVNQTAQFQALSIYTATDHQSKTQNVTTGRPGHHRISPLQRLVRPDWQPQFRQEQQPSQVLLMEVLVS